MDAVSTEIDETQLEGEYKSLWVKAKSAIEVQNAAYAISIIQAILKKYPGFVDGRRLLRQSEVGITGAKKKKQGLFSGGGLSNMKLQGQAKKDPLASLELIEKELVDEPLDPHLNEILHDTAMRLNLLETAAFALETIRQGAPEHTKLLHRLAEHYMARDLPDKASEVYRDIVKQDPSDMHAVKGDKDASARASMQSQNWSEEADIKTLLKSQSESEELENQNRAAMTKDQLREKIATLLVKYNEDQYHLETVKELGKSYEQLEEWGNCYTFYSWGAQISEGDVALKNKSLLMKDKATNEYLSNLEAQVEADPDNEELSNQLLEARREHSAERLKECQERVEQNPTDPQVRYDLGKAYYDSAMYSEAIPHLQQATRNPHIRTKVLLLLGKTFDAKGMTDLAIKQFEEAIHELTAMDKVKKELLYELGLIFGKQGHPEKSIGAFKQIYEVDYGYRDVAARVEGSY